jgi:hypothetical protein
LNNKLKRRHLVQIVKIANLISHHHVPIYSSLSFLILDGSTRWPVFYVEVSSLDSWQRYQTEGYSYMTLPTTAGKSKYTMIMNTKYYTQYIQI